MVDWSKIGCNLSTGSTAYSLQGREHFRFKLENNVLKSVSYSTRNLKVQLKNQNFQYQVDLEIVFNKDASEYLTFSGTHTIFMTENLSSPKGQSSSTQEYSKSNPVSQQNNNPTNSDITVTVSNDTISIDPTSLEEFFEQNREKRSLTAEELLLDPIYAQFLKSKRQELSLDESQIQAPQYMDLTIDSEFSGVLNSENSELILTGIDTEILIENFRMGVRDRKTIITENHMKLMNSSQGSDQEGVPAAISLDNCGNASGIMEYELDFNKSRKDKDYFFITVSDFLFQKNQNKLTQLKCVKSHNPSVAALLNSMQRLLNSFNGGGTVIK